MMPAETQFPATNDATTKPFTTSQADPVAIYTMHCLNIVNTN